jgi:hypothetical protein
MHACARVSSALQCEQGGLAVDPEIDYIARSAINFLIEDAKVDFKGERQEAFIWAIFHAVRKTDPAELQNLRELVKKYQAN